MPDLLHRERYEGEVEAGMLALLRRQRARLAEMGIEEAAQRSEEEWQQDQDEAAALLFLLLMRPWEEAYTYLSGSVGLIQRPTVRQEQYGEWARVYTSRLGQEIVGTNRKVVQRYRAKQVEGDTLTATELRLTVLAMPERAESIGITETTRAASAAETAAASQYGLINGRLLLPYWYTEKDDRVCSICGPLHNEPGTVWRHRFAFGPPAHPRCRCWQEWKVV